MFTVLNNADKGLIRLKASSIYLVVLYMGGTSSDHAYSARLVGWPLGLAPPLHNLVWP